MNVIFGLGAFQSLVFSVLLLIKRENKQADKFLSGFFFIASLYLFNIYSVKFSLWKLYPDILFIYTLIFLIYGPLLFFYVSSLIGKDISLKEILIHAIPIITVFLIILPFVFSSKEEKLLCFTDKFINMPVNIAIGTFLQYLSSPVYFIWILVLLKKHKKHLKDKYSSVDKINLNWMHKLLIGGISIWLIECLNVIALNFTEFEFIYTYNTSWYIKFAFMLFVMFIGYYGINQGNVFSKIKNENTEFLSDNVLEESIKALKFHIQNEQTDNIVPIEDVAMNLKVPAHVLMHIINLKIPQNDINKNNEKTKLISDELAKKYTKELIKYIKDEKVYLNNELRIQDISINLNIPVHILSYILNTELNQNFYDFINSYRIKEVKKRLHDTAYNNLTILAIAFDCGFNSKSTFNRLFKQYTGITPSQYIKKNPS